MATTLPSEDARTLLVAAGVVFADTTVDWTIYIGKMMDKPNKAVSIIDAGGFSPNPKWLLDYPSIQVKVRGAPNGYSEARLKAIRIKDELLGIISLDVNGNRWASVTMAGDIVMLGYDQSERPMFTLNFNLIIQPSASADTNRQSLT
jgi:Bacteriophage minor capsid protein